MRAIARRIRRLEARLALQEDLASWRIANLIYERRRPHAKAEGRPFTDLPPERPGKGPHLSIAETLRRCREQLAKLPKEPSSVAGRAEIPTDISS